MKKSLVMAVLLLSGCASRPAQSSCSLTPGDQAWLDRSVRGWITTRREVLEAAVPTAQDAVVFDRDCELHSTTAMLTSQSQWSATPITSKQIRIGGQQISIGVVSATIGGEGGTRFVMSTPSVWRDAHVPPGSLGLETLMSAVMMHEATHVFQMGTYGKDVDALQKTNHLSDEQFNDDAIQAHYKTNVDFADSISREIHLFFSAADATNDQEATRLARRARALMKMRATRYYVGDQEYQNRAEDLWLTMEGSAQWAGYRWLLLPEKSGGAGVSISAAMNGFGKRGDAWTQLEGLAIALTVDRLDHSGWKRHVFGDGKGTLLEILDRSISSRK